jgi:NAD(P)-dependent dehydrogenase (short-subunit alcohol dehydrogenase family)
VVAATKRNNVLITGAARRIGRRLALDLAEEGWSVAIHCNESIADAETLAQEIAVKGGEAVIVRGDLSEADVSQRLIDEGSRALGGLTCLINNTSRFEPDEADSITLQSWAAHLDTNLRAPVFLSQGVAAQLPDGAEGNIINIIDERVWKLTPKYFSYTASKSALWTVTRTLAQAFAPCIRVNAIGPGPAVPNVRMIVLDGGQHLLWQTRDVVGVQE